MSLLRLTTLLALIIACLAATPAAAGSVLDRVKAQHEVRCGSAERPGLAAAASDGGWSGLLVDVCRAVASAVLADANAVAFDAYTTPAQFERVRRGEDDVFFLTGNDIHLNGLAGRVLPGPAVYYETHTVMVPAASAAQNISDLAGRRICVLTGSRVERSLSAYFERRNLAWQPIPFTEDGEMQDGYKAGICDAVAYERSTLASLGDAGVGGHSRILGDSLSTFPLLAATGVEDAQWSAIVAWTTDTLIAGERPETPWYAGGAGAMPVAAPELGLDAGWQRRVLSTVGDYGQIFERTLGTQSALRLARGVNASPPAGGLLLAPFLE